MAGYGGEMERTDRENGRDGKVKNGRDRKVKNCGRDNGDVGCILIERRKE